MGRYRVVFEGVSPEFGSDLEAWLRDSVGLRAPDVEGNGRVCILVVDQEAVLDKMSELLDNPETGPENLYCAVLPPYGERLMPRTFVGSAFEAENDRVEAIPGRHILLGGLPPKLARK